MTAEEVLIKYTVTCYKVRRSCSIKKQNAPKDAFYCAFPEYLEKPLLLESVDITLTGKYDVRITEYLDTEFKEYKEYYYNLVPGEVPEEQKKYKERVAKADNIVSDPEHPSKGKQLGE